MPQVARSMNDPQVPCVMRTLTELCLVALLALASSGTRAADAEAPIHLTPSAELFFPEQPLKAETAAELQAYLRARDAHVDLFRAQGPFGVVTQQDRELRLTTSERIDTDLFLAALSEKAPLVILLHGYDSSKRAHAKQAAHLASWGMHSLTIQLPNHGPWDANGRTLAKLVSAISRSPDAIDRRIDTSRIILVGHSFGAYAVAVALAEGAPAMGGILLDPAGVGRELPTILRRIRKPVMVLGADDEVVAPRNRDYFFEFVRNPSDFALQNGGVDPHTNEELQVTFVSALTAAAISLANTGTFEYAWASFRPVFEKGRFFNAKKK
jgi:pimeloyl-ACP methyl ester carboxylesterase